MLSVHQRYACMGCRLCSNGCGEPPFFDEDRSAALHYSRSSHCNKSMCEIKTVSVQLNTRPQYFGDTIGEAGGGGAPGAWRPQPAPYCSAGAMMRAKIS